MKNLLFILLISTIIHSFAQRGNTIPKTNPAQNAAPTAKSKTTQKSITSNSSGTITFTVFAETVPCDNNPSAKCLQIKRQGNSSPETIEDIENFNYDIGYIYTIIVKEVLKTSSVTPGESAYRYIWVKTLTKTEAESTSGSAITPAVIMPEANQKPSNINGKTIGQTNIQTSSLLDGKWYLRKLKEAEGSSFVTDDNIMWIEINTFKDRIDGFGACNKFATVVKSDLKTTFEISKLTSNYAICGNKKIEDLFYNLLEQTDRFEIKNGRLILSKQWKYLLEFVSDPNNKEDILSTYTPPTIVENKEMIYATNESLNQSAKSKPETVSASEPIPSTTPEAKTAPQVDISSTTPAVNNPTAVKTLVEMDAKDKEIAELKKLLAEQKNDKAQQTVETENNITAKPEPLTNNPSIKTKEQLEQEKLDLETETLKKQLAEKKLKEEADKAAALKLLKEEETKKIAEAEKAKASKLKEIEELKRQLAEKEAVLEDANSTQNNKPTEKSIEKGKNNNDEKIIAKKEETYVSKDEFKTPTEKEIEKAEESKIKIGLINFTGPSNLRSYTAILQDKVSACFTSKNRFTIVDRTKFEQISNERELQKSEEFIDGFIVEQGKSTGAKFIVTGQLSDISSTSTLYTKKNSNGQITGHETKYQAQISFSLSILDVETGASKSAKSFTISTSQSNAGLSFLSGMLGGTPGYNSESAAVAEVYNRLQGYVLGWINAVFPVEMKILRVETTDKNGLPATVTVKGGADTDLKKKSDLNVIIYEKLESDGQQFIKPKIIGQLVVQEVTGEFSTCKVKNGEKEIDENLKSNTLMKLEIKSYK